MSSIEGLYIFDNVNNPILEHVYTRRPPAAASLLTQYLATPSPRPSVTYLTSTSPSTLVFALSHNGLLFLCPVSAEIEPLLVLEFLHRVIDALEDFLGSPLLASKIENNYDVVIQIVSEICDAGIVSNTEPNALGDVVEVPTWMSGLLGGLGLPAASPALSARSHSPSFQQGGHGLSSGFGNTSNTSATGSAIPWRRSNVRHTSNELYVDIIERLAVIIAPSGRPLSAFAQGSIAFTSKVSGVPDLLLNLTAPGGKQGLQHSMSLPCFHPCVRLARWRDHPGELSFVPPDGKFILAGYECDLLPDLFGGDSVNRKIPEPGLKLPLSMELLTSLGQFGDEFEIRLTFPLRNSSKELGGNRPSSAMGSRTASSGSRSGGSQGPTATTGNSSNSSGPAVEDILITIPVSAGTRNVADIKSSKGEAHFAPNETVIEWRIPTKEAATVSSAGATMRATIVGTQSGTDGQENSIKATPGSVGNMHDYDEDVDGSYQGIRGGRNPPKSSKPSQFYLDDQSTATLRRSNAIMPQSALMSFNVKGWLASGIKVDSLTINTRTSKGIGAGVAPYKGVKYHTTSHKGVEIRCS